MGKERKRRKSKIKRGLTFVFLGFALLMMGLYTLQEKMIFLPEKLEPDFQFQFEQPFEELFFTARDGAKLNALHFKAQAPKGIIVYFHGNAGNLERWGNIVQFFVEKDWDVLVMDYRTYGKSIGELSEDTLFSDTQLFYNYANKHFSENRIIIYGRSLGCAMATYTATKNNPLHLILEAPFYDLHDIARRRVPIIPLKPLLKYHFKNNENIKQVNCPIVIFHGTEDKIVPYDSGERLFKEITSNSKDFITIREGGHNNLIEFNEYRSKMEHILINIR